MKHIVDKNELKNCIREVELASSCSKNENKRLIARVDFNNKKINFRVFNKGKIETIEMMDNLDDAIDVYNNLI